MREYIFTRKAKNGKLEKVGSLTLNLNEDLAKLYFYGDICSGTWQSQWFAEDTAPQDIVDFLAQIEGIPKLEVHINSGGGSVYGGLAIYNILKRFNVEKIAYIDGIAASIASILPFACDRVIAKSGSQIMIHKPYSHITGNADEMRKEAEALDIAQKALVDVYMNHVKDGITEEQINDMVNCETWLTGADAAEIFEIEVQNGAQAVAAVSGFYEKYGKKPSIPIATDDVDKNKKRRLQLELELLTL